MPELMPEPSCTQSVPPERGSGCQTTCLALRTMRLTCVPSARITYAFPFHKSAMRLPSGTRLAGLLAAPAAGRTQVAEMSPGSRGQGHGEGGRLHFERSRTRTASYTRFADAVMPKPTTRVISNSSIICET